MFSFSRAFKTLLKLQASEPCSESELANSRGHGERRKILNSVFNNNQALAKKEEKKDGSALGFFTAIRHC